MGSFCSSEVHQEDEDIKTCSQIFDAPLRSATTPVTSRVKKLKSDFVVEFIRAYTIEAANERSIYVSIVYHSKIKRESEAWRLQEKRLWQKDTLNRTMKVNTLVLNDIVRDSKIRNRFNEITSGMYYDPVTNLIQHVFEGPPRETLRLWLNIKNDDRHEIFASRVSVQLHRSRNNWDYLEMTTFPITTLHLRENLIHSRI